IAMPDCGNLFRTSDRGYTAHRAARERLAFRNTGEGRHAPSRWGEPMRSPAIRIGLVFSYSMEYCRGVLRGIKQYAETKQHWIFTPIALDLPELPLPRAVHPAGLITFAVNEAVAGTLTKLRKPMVNVSANLPDLPLPRVGVDNVAVGRMAATYLIN